MDWFDHFSDAVVRLGFWLSEGRSLKRMGGILCACLALIVLVAVADVIYLELPRDPRHLLWIAPAEILFIGLAGYCLLTPDR